MNEAPSLTSSSFPSTGGDKNANMLEDEISSKERHGRAGLKA